VTDQIVEVGLVSTIIPVYNRTALLREAVASVLAQTYRPIEVIVVDDGSTDDTPQTCAALAEARHEVRTLRIPNGGPGRAREAGRLLARGEFVQYLDSDDLLRPHKFETQVAALRARPECGACYGPTEECRLDDAEHIWPSPHGERAVEFLFPGLLVDRPWQTPAPLWRRSTTDAAGPWTDLGQEEDIEYDARVAALGVRVVRVPQVVALIRHPPTGRASGGSLVDPRRMRWRAQAHALVYAHARRAGIESTDPHMQRYARELFLLARQCGASSLGQESRQLFDLAREASGAVRGRGWDFRIYRTLAQVVGWPALGRLTCWTDRFRSTSPA
jgi:glycosyltransferase involved in cell wall biosynthesis